MRWIPVALALLAASPAEAASVRATVVDDSWKDSEFRNVTWQVVDRQDVPDRLVVRTLADGIEVSAARPLTAGRACRKLRPRVVRCATPHRPGADTSVELSIDLAGGDDHLLLRGERRVHAKVAAGGGRDVVDGRRAPDGFSVTGGPGADRLLGSPYDDRLTGGPGADVLRGGGGADLAAWEGTRPVRADLVTGTARSGGTTDTLRSIESLSGGSGADDLRGDARRNEITGGGGGDRILGRAGDDRVDGEGLGGEDRAVDVVDGGSGDDWVSGLGGGDVLIGGDGDDRLRNYLNLPSGTRGSRARCGDGRDLVDYPAPEDVVEPDCEVIDHRANGFGGPRMDVPPVIVTENWGARIAYECNAQSEQGCPVTVVLADAGTAVILGSAEAQVADGAEQTIGLRLTPEGLAQVRRRGALLGRLSVRRGDQGFVLGATLRLRAPG
jgi:hypothetical protein